MNLSFANNYEIPFRVCEYVILFILVHKDLSNFRCPNLNQLNRHCSNSNLSTAAFITAGWLGNLIHDSQQQKKKVAAVSRDLTCTYMYIGKQAGKSDVNSLQSKLLMLSKVRIFWEGHKIWKNLPLKIGHYSVTSNFTWKIFSNFVAFSEYPNFKKDQ